MLLAIIPSQCKHLNRLYNFGADYIYAKSDVSPKNWNVCNKMAKYLITCTIRVNLFVVLSYALAICAPLWKTLCTDEKEMILPVILPFINPDTKSGFEINYIYQVITCAFGSFIVPGCELILCIMKNNVSAIAAVIVNAVTEFQIRLEKNDDAVDNILLEYRNLILKILDFDRLNQKV